MSEITTGGFTSAIYLFNWNYISQEIYISLSARIAVLNIAPAGPTTFLINIVKTRIRTDMPLQCSRLNVTVSAVRQHLECRARSCCDHDENDSVQCPIPVQHLAKHTHGTKLNCVEILTKVPCLGTPQDPWRGLVSVRLLVVILIVVSHEFVAPSLDGRRPLRSWC